mmetsp:Transcript_53242/g.116625  ORF Transcript_53242/g.116625 Transcript_53242/m.116625 type:complete len:662 (-) Transcript_53242:125-2110(-)
MVAEKSSDGKVEVTVRSEDEQPEEVVIRVLPTVTLKEVRILLAETLRRPEIKETGEFKDILKDGRVVPLEDDLKLLKRRVLCFAGVALTAVEEPPLRSLDDFDAFSEDGTIGSPRTLRACALEGVLVEELFYMPLEEFSSPDLEPRLARLRHDFHEAYRQDTVALVADARKHIMKEDEELLLGGTSPGGWPRSPASQGSPTSALARSPVGGTGPWAAASAGGLSGESVAGIGGIWAGPLAPNPYPKTYKLFEELTKLTNLERVYEGPLQNADLGEQSTAGRWAADPMQGGISYLEKVRHGEADAYDSIVDSEQKVSRMVNHLNRLPGGKGEQVVGLALRTESLTVSQRTLNMERMDRKHHEDIVSAKMMVATAEAQKDIANNNLTEVKELRSYREKMSKASRGPWTSGVQETNSTAAARRDEHWMERREVVHQSHLEAERKRNEVLENRCQGEAVREKRVADIRDKRRIHFARGWLDRRIRWGHNHATVSAGNNAFKDLILAKQAESQARVNDQHVRQQKSIEFKRELKALRRALVEMAARREKRRQEFRKKAVSKELVRIAHERSRMMMEADAFLMSQTAMGCSHRTMLPDSPSMRSWADSSQPGAGRPKRLPRFDFGRFGADSLHGPAGGFGATWQSSGTRPLTLSTSASAPGLLALGE